MGKIPNFYFSLYDRLVGYQMKALDKENTITSSDFDFELIRRHAHRPRPFLVTRNAENSSTINNSHVGYQKKALDAENVNKIIKK